jgi:serine/threonine protein kinase
MFMEFQFEDIVFGIFPLVGGEMLDAFGYWPKNYVGDIIDMIMQMLEVSFYLRYICLSQYSINYLKALEFIHDLNIAHRVSTPPILLIF